MFAKLMELGICLQIRPRTIKGLITVQLRKFQDSEIIFTVEGCTSLEYLEEYLEGLLFEMEKHTQYKSGQWIVYCGKWEQFQEARQEVNEIKLTKERIREEVETIIDAHISPLKERVIDGVLETLSNSI